jgi:osomolarity two-component system phosphorelay intermediate protein YPD1
MQLTTHLFAPTRTNKNLDALSSLGHFLKGSSATLGFTKVKDECEKIQHYGHKLNETGEVEEPDEAKCLRLIRQSLAEAKNAYEVVNVLMKRFYGDA